MYTVLFQSMTRALEFGGGVALGMPKKQNLRCERELSRPSAFSKRGLTS